MGGRAIAKKSLESLFSGTGLDPEPSNRKRLLRKTKKALKKSASTSSSGSSSSTSSETMEDENMEILQDRSRVHRISSLAPGLLTSSSIEVMKTYLVRVMGTGWEEDQRGLPPIMSLYHRSYVAGRVSGGQGREFATLSHASDLLLQGRAAESLDVMTQRMKSIEMTAGGGQLGNESEAGAGPPQRTRNGKQKRVSSGPARIEAGSIHQRHGWKLREGKRKNKREGSRERQRERERQRKDHGQDQSREGRLRSPRKGDEEVSEEAERRRRGRSLPRVGEKEVVARGGREAERKSPSKVELALPRVGEDQGKKQRSCTQSEAAKEVRGKMAKACQLGAMMVRRLEKAKEKAKRREAKEKARCEERKNRMSSGKNLEEKGTHGTCEKGGVCQLPSQTPPRTVQAATYADFSKEPSLRTESDGASGSSSGMGRALSEKKGSSGEPVVLGDLISWLDSRMDVLVGRLCKAPPSGRLYPLPTSMTLLAQLFPESSVLVLKFLRCLVLGLNSLNGEGTTGPDQASDFQVKVLGELLRDCERVSVWKSNEEAPSWEQFFRVRGIDYKGEEVLTAQVMRWENVRSALPAEVGTVPLEQVVELGSLHYVKHFEDYLLDPQDQVAVRPPRVLVPPENWEDFCTNLLRLGVFDKVHESELYQVQGKPLLNGLFGVSKQEFDGPWEVQRIIMNLIPVNAACRSFEGDVSTLPSWAGMTPMHLQPHEDLIVSSEDIRCFFYIFKLPRSWHRFLAFNRPLPSSLRGDRPGQWYPCSAVLPMGFKNSVALAQHVHRYILKQALRTVNVQGSEAELRKDRAFTVANPTHRIYLDNFDELERVSSQVSSAIKGQLSPLVEGLQETYSSLGVPRHPTKGVARQPVAEVQGAIVDGQAGIAHPKVDKVLKYAFLGYLVLQQDYCSQKQMQVIGGGFVYMAMFRRPLLGALNHLWQFILAFEGQPPVIKLAIPDVVKQEIARFLGLLPLAYMDFRCSISHQVTASDASEYGGGVTYSESLTPAGVVASNCSIRGDLVEPIDIPLVLTIGIFDGIAALRVATDALGWNVCAHISIEKSPEAARVVESRFPQTIFVKDVNLVTDAMVKEWSQQFTQVSLVLVGAGPPCQGVSGLNASKKGAIADPRSNLFIHVPRIRELVKQAFPWAQVRSLMESVSSMDSSDEHIMSDAYGSHPWHLDAGGLGLCHRPRLYWLDWELQPGDDCQFGFTPMGRSSVTLKADTDVSQFLSPGWHKPLPGPFPTFTTSRPRQSPGYKPAGLKQCDKADIARWENDSYRFPPYQYQPKHCVANKHQQLRVPNAQEREVLMGFPKDYTVNCLPKGQQKTEAHHDTRLTLIGSLGLRPYCPKSRRRPQSASAEAQMEMMPKRHLEAPTEQERAKTRQALGSLRELTVQPVTKARYQQAREEFYAWLHNEKLVLPSSAYQLDLVISDYLEHLWATGKGRSVGSNILAAVQDHQPHLKGKLKMSWRLMKTWVTHEIPCRAPPFSLDVLHLMVGYCLFKGLHHFALSLLLCFHGLLRTGELLDVRARNIAVTDPKGPAVISLGFTKSGKRQGAAESVTINSEDVCRRLLQWKNSVHPNSLLTGTNYAWRKQFASILEALHLDEMGYRPYSLRRGGATHYFQLYGNFDKLLILGRWQAIATARLYINEGLSVLTQLTIPWNPPNRVFRSQYLKSLTQPLPKLDPETKTRSSQTRGRWKNKVKKGKAVLKHPGVVRTLLSS
eukprot:Skav234605  [mRNA]  locus=scaffold5214:352284:358006:- [translate_table: standard]